MNVFGVSSTQGMQGVGAVQGTEASTVSAHRGVGDVHDAVDLSVEGVRAADSVVDIRFDRVSAIRTAIAAGTYETAEKLDIALDRLLDRLS